MNRRLPTEGRRGTNRRLQSVTLYVTKDLDIILPDKYHDATGTTFMHFASRLDRAWTNSQYVDYVGVPSTTTRSAAHNAKFHIRKREGQYQFSLGLIRRGRVFSDSFGINQDKSGWPFDFACNEIIVYERKPYKPTDRTPEQED